MASSVISRGSRDLGKQRTPAVQDHQRIQDGASGFLLPHRLAKHVRQPRGCPGGCRARVACGSPAQPAVTRSGGGCSLSPRVTAVIAGLLAGRGACCLSAPETMARATATAAYQLGASTVTALTMVSAVCSDDAGGPAPCCLASCRYVGYRVRKPGRSRATGPAKMLFVTTARFGTS